MTDNDKAARDEAFRKVCRAYGVTDTTHRAFFNHAFDAALAHTEAQHAERARVLVDAVQHLLDTFKRRKELHTIFLTRAYSNPLFQDVEQMVGAKNILQSALSEYRGKE